MRRVFQLLPNSQCRETSSDHGGSGANTTISLLEESILDPAESRKMVAHQHGRRCNWRGAGSFQIRSFIQ